MIDAGIHPGDILIVDKSIDPLPNNIVIAVVGGEFLVKRLISECGVKYLVPDNPDFGRIELREDDKVEIWGVVTYVIHKLR
jgi:DNA polymerase V